MFIPSVLSATSINFFLALLLQMVGRPQKNGVKKFAAGRVKQRMRGDLYQSLDILR